MKKKVKVSGLTWRYVPCTKRYMLSDGFVDWAWASRNPDTPSKWQASNYEMGSCQFDRLRDAKAWAEKMVK